jgi:hypothetical protein
LQWVAQIATSPDGLDWTARIPTTTNNLRAIAYGNGSFVATGDRGAIVSSVNGISWTDSSRNTTRSLRGVAHGGGWWVIVTDPSGHYSSPDGVTWTFRGSLVLTTILPTYSVAFGGDSFFVVGSWGQVLESRRAQPSGQDITLGLRYTSRPFLRINGPEGRRYDIEATDQLTPIDRVAWQPFTSVSNYLGVVNLPVGNATNPPTRFFRALLRE